MKIIAIINQKGGVGKTATAINLAYGLATIDCQPTLLVDMDPNGHAWKAFNPNIEIQLTIKDLLLNKELHPDKATLEATIKNNKIANLFFIPAKLNLAPVQEILFGKAHKEKILHKQLEKVSNEYKWVVIDCPPTLSSLTVNAIYAANFLLIPIKYEKDALEGVADLFTSISEIKEDIHFDYKILRNSYDCRKTRTNQFIDDMLTEFDNKGKLMNTKIRNVEDINQAKICDEPVFTYNPKSQAVSDYISLTKEIIDND
jgi:chromosome partitioning protein